MMHRYAIFSGSDSVWGLGRQAVAWTVGGLLMGLSLSIGARAQDSAQGEPQGRPLWEQPLPVLLDPELRDEIQRVRGALRQLHVQITQHEQALGQTESPETRAELEEELETLGTQRQDFETLLEKLVEEANRSEQTEVDQALERTRWFELRRQYDERKEEAIRERQ